MNAPFLMILFDSIFLIAMSALVGSVLFFSFAVAPIVFKTLGAEMGGRFVRALFPRYYMWGAISGAVALPCLVQVPLSFPEYRGAWVGIQALAIMTATLIMLYAGNVLTPAINSASDSGMDGRARFKRLHRRSVQLNALVLAIGIGLLIAFAARPKPRTQGIVELNPMERTAAEVEFLSRPPSAKGLPKTRP